MCGDKYEACHTTAVKNTFRWQEVACSPECGAEYLRRVQQARGIEVEDEYVESTMYNEDVNGFDGEPDDEYISGFGDE